MLVFKVNTGRQYTGVLTFRIKENGYIDTTFRKDSYEAMKASCGLIHVTMELQSSVSGSVSDLHDITPDVGRKKNTSLHPLAAKALNFM